MFLSLLNYLLKSYGYVIIKFFIYFVRLVFLIMHKFLDFLYYNISINIYVFNLLRYVKPAYFYADLTCFIAINVVHH